jgi:high-affinity iron transporter
MEFIGIDHWLHPSPPTAVSPFPRMTHIAVARTRSIHVPRAAVLAGAVLVFALLIWQALTQSGAPDPTLARTTTPAAVLDIAVLVFREGLECILVLSAITAGMRGRQTRHREPIAWGALAAAGATILTWILAIRAIDALSRNVSALHIQAVTGLLAIVVLLVVMNWFFHRIYWTGWIGAHNRRKRDLLGGAGSSPQARRQLLLGLGMLGFTSVYREGFEVVLFLQSYRLQLGGAVVLGGVLIGTALAAVVAVLTFVLRRKLPYKKMLVVTGLMLAAVLFVMVGEQAQEMQLAHWLPTTPIHTLVGRVPDWAGLWFSVFPTVETLVAQGAAAVLIFGSYALARARTLRTAGSAA